MITLKSIQLDLQKPFFRPLIDKEEQRKIMSMTKELVDHFKSTHLNIYYEVRLILISKSIKFCD